MTALKTQVLIIGGGATGTGLARDLALRGVACTLAEQYEINAGASGANHGLLHSGGRYVFTDADSARECRMEAELLKQLAPDCIDDTGGLFVAVKGDDEKYAADFPALCRQCDIPVKPLGIEEARELEPALSPKLIAAYWVPDAAIDPFKLSFDNMAQARDLGSTLLGFTKTVAFEKDNGTIRAARLKNTLTGEETRIEADCVVNAAGAWAGDVAKLAGCAINILFSKGSLLVTHNRITHRVVNRLRPSANADILVPGGTVSLLGTTSVRIENLDQIRPTIAEVDAMVTEAAGMIPVLKTTRYIRAFAGVRPLMGSADANDDRGVSRGFALLDHKKDGLKNFITISGGKLTTYRLMAERTADLVCAHLGVSSPCKTRTEPLPASSHTKWSRPRLSSTSKPGMQAEAELFLCECERVSKGTVDVIVEDIRRHKGRPSLRGIGLRSRVGKGACQGTFCGPRLTTYLYDKGVLELDQCGPDLKEFILHRWKGQRPILWGRQLVQSELLEAMHCGLLGLELPADESDTNEICTSPQKITFLQTGLSKKGFSRSRCDKPVV